MTQTDADRHLLEQFFQQEAENFFAIDRIEGNERKSLKTVCQALFWGCALLEYHKRNTPQYQRILAKCPDKDTIKGFRYARNRAAHQFTQLLEITGGMAIPAVPPAPFFEIVWKPMDQIPAADRRHQRGKEEYKQHLAGEPVRFTLEKLSEFFKGLVPHCHTSPVG